MVQCRYPDLKPEEIDHNSLLQFKKKAEADMNRWCAREGQWPVTAPEFDVRYLVKKPQPDGSAFTGTVVVGYVETESLEAVRGMYEHYHLRPPLAGEAQRCMVEGCPHAADHTMLLENQSATEYDGRILKLYVCEGHARELNPAPEAKS